MTTSNEYTVIWVCEDCLFDHVAPGENEHRTPDEVPWSRKVANDYVPGYPYGYYNRYGIGDCEHDFERDFVGGDNAAIDAHTEVCSTVDFSSSPCDACSTRLAGTRHAFTLFEH